MRVHSRLAFSLIGAGAHSARQGFYTSSTVIPLPACPPALLSPCLPARLRCYPPARLPARAVIPLPACLPACLPTRTCVPYSDALYGHWPEDPTVGTSEYQRGPDFTF